MKGQISLEFLFSFLVLLVFVGSLLIVLLDFYNKLKEQEEVVRLTIDAENKARLHDTAISSEYYKGYNTTKVENSKIEISYGDKTVTAETIANIEKEDTQHI